MTPSGGGGSGGPDADTRALLRDVRDRLDGWVYEAREEAYDALFEGPDAVLDDAELAELDRLDSAATRWTGSGVWGEDEYGIVVGDPTETDPGFRVVCTYHPQLPEDEYPGGDDLDEATRERYDQVLWEYAERVAAGAQDRLEAYLYDEPAGEAAERTAEGEDE